MSIVAEALKRREVEALEQIAIAAERIADAIDGGSEVTAQDDSGGTGNGPPPGR